MYLVVIHPYVPTHNPNREVMAAAYHIYDYP